MPSGDDWHWLDSIEPILANEVGHRFEKKPAKNPSNIVYQAWFQCKKRLLSMEATDELKRLSWSFNIPDESDQNIDIEQLEQELGGKAQSLLLLADVFKFLSENPNATILRIRSQAGMKKGDEWGPKVVLKCDHVYQMYGPSTDKRRETLKTNLKRAERCRNTALSTDMYAWERGPHGSDQLLTGLFDGGKSLNETFADNPKDAVEGIWRYFFPIGTNRLQSRVIKQSLEDVKKSLPRLKEKNFSYQNSHFNLEKLLGKNTVLVLTEATEKDSETEKEREYCFVHGDEWGENFLASESFGLYMIDLEDALLLDYGEHGTQPEDYINGRITSCGGRLWRRIVNALDEAVAPGDPPPHPAALSTVLSAARLVAALIQYASFYGNVSSAPQVTKEWCDGILKWSCETFSKRLEQNHEIDADMRRDATIQFLLGCLDWGMHWEKKRTETNESKFPDSHCFFDAVAALLQAASTVDKEDFWNPTTYNQTRRTPEGTSRRIQFRLDNVVGFTKDELSFMRRPVRDDPEIESVILDKISKQGASELGYGPDGTTFFDVQSEEWMYVQSKDAKPWVSINKDIPDQQERVRSGGRAIHIRIDTSLLEKIGAPEDMMKEAEASFHILLSMCEKAAESAPKLHFEAVDYNEDHKLQSFKKRPHLVTPLLLFFDLSTLTHHLEHHLELAKSEDSEYSAMVSRKDNFVALHSVCAPKDHRGEALQQLHGHLVSGHAVIWMPKDTREYAAIISAFLEQTARVLVCMITYPEDRYPNLRKAFMTNRHAGWKRSEREPPSTTINISPKPLPTGEYPVHPPEIYQSNHMLWLNPILRHLDSYLFDPGADAWHEIDQFVRRMEQIRNINFTASRHASSADGLIEDIQKNAPFFTQSWAEWEVEVKRMHRSLKGLDSKMKTFSSEKEWKGVVSAAMEVANVNTDGITGPLEKIVRCAQLRLALVELGNAMSKYDPLSVQSEFLKGLFEF